MYVSMYLCVWRFSFLYCHRIHIHKVWAPPVATLLHMYIHTYIHIPFDFIALHISLVTACGDSVSCCSGTASGDPCHFILFHRIISVGTASGNPFTHTFHLNLSHHFYLGTACGCSVFCSVIELCMYIFVKIWHRQWRSFYFI